MHEVISLAQGEVPKTEQNEEERLVRLQHRGEPAPAAERGGRRGNDEPERGGNGGGMEPGVAGREEGRGGRANGPGVGLRGRAARPRLASLQICRPNCLKAQRNGPPGGPERGDARAGRRGSGSSGASAIRTRTGSGPRGAWLQGAIPTLRRPLQASTGSEPGQPAPRLRQPRPDSRARRTPGPLLSGQRDPPIGALGPALGRWILAPHTHRASLPRFAARADWLQYRTPKPNQRLQPPPPPPLPLPRKMANLNKEESGLPPTAFAQAPSRPRPITPASLAPPPRGALRRRPGGHTHFLDLTPPSAGGLRRRLLQAPY
ncbi:WAS/WASL-interacting protein family member 2-like [Phodopus roborovskii]|uniref:WAS/WASL-interacting protein family member 2-like n=1 Tax=Phodopus roborovskii TaxID=109678 RepID=UPI0021E50524|nr:WAS/WASL-interacting protein family member 2-like [Phodopus roborovskii]